MSKQGMGGKCFRSLNKILSDILMNERVGRRRARARINMSICKGWHPIVSLPRSPPGVVMSPQSAPGLQISCHRHKKQILHFLLHYDGSHSCLSGWQTRLQTSDGGTQVMVELITLFQIPATLIFNSLAIDSMLQVIKGRS